MKILFLARRYAPQVGGVETHLAYLNRELLKSHSLQNVEITVVAEQDDPRLLLTEKIDEVIVQRIPLPNAQTSK